jgi:hypothetical protein
VKTRKLRSPIPIGRGFLIFRGPVYGFENIGGFVLKVRLVRFQKIRKFCRGKWGWVYRPTLTSPHLTSPHLTSPHLTSPAPPAVFYAIWDKLTGDQRRAAHSFKAEK